jgi:hypothetical protein
MKFLVVTRTPSRQGVLGPIPERVDVEEVERDSFNDLLARLQVPLGGDARICPMDSVSRVVAEKVNRIV